MFLYKVTYFLAVLRESVLIICAGYVACGFITGTVILRTVLYVYFYNLPLRKVLSYVTVPGKRDHFRNFFKIELLLQQERVGFELQNALHI